MRSGSCRQRSPSALVRGIACLAAVLVMAAAGGGSWRLLASSHTWYVDVNRCPATGSGTQADPFCYIQDAICAASAGDLVSVAPGTYNEAIRMKPSVDVVSQAGPTMTTINGAGKPCVTGNYCTRTTMTQCSVVMFVLGHTPDTLLEGFTVTGGAGYVDNDQIIGGGLLIYSSPTINDTIVTNNVLSGPAPQNRHMNGAGVYIAIGRPIITNSTISNNIALPLAGASNNYTSAYGGGVWSNIEASPTIRDSLIQGNVAGDPNRDFSINTGGGMVLFGHHNASFPTIIERNVIADNRSGDNGGGIAVLGFPLSIAEVKITNNVFVGNFSDKGGALYTYKNFTTAVNNTMVGNTALFFGGGVFTGRQKSLPVSIANDIIQQNTIQTFPGGQGGGIFHLNVDPNEGLVVSHNNIFGNSVGQCRGELTDANCNGVNGNISSDSLFMNRPNRDFRLTIGSPSIDMADAARSPYDDLVRISRGIDGDGSVNAPRPGDVDMGTLESIFFCNTLTEICDGVDNNCSFTIDEGFPDFDMDASADCVDPDDDNDGVADASDCRPFDNTAFGVPTGVANVLVSAGSPTQISFDPQAIGSGTQYEILSGLTSRIRPAGMQEMFCMQSPIAGIPWVDPRPNPPPGDAWFYDVRSMNACGIGPLGTPPRDAAGAGDACATGVWDLDVDGSPSDFDCDDQDALRSPLFTETCDGVDNNCNFTVDEGFGQTTCGVGACRRTVDNCSGGMIQTCVPGAPVAETCDLVDNDCDGATDNGLGQTTCGVGECRRTVQNCVGGTTQTCTPGAPAAEVCDGLDNDCNGLVDDGFPDTDFDGTNDCLDPDDDNDGVLDGGDCAPLDATAFAVPAEVADLIVAAGVPTTMTWTEQSLGTGTAYDVATGEILTPGTVPFSAGTCLATTTTGSAQDLRPDPAPGAAHYYLVKSKNACGPGTFGPAPRDTHPGCS